MNAAAFKASSVAPRYRWRLVTFGGVSLAAVHILLLRRLELGDFTPDLYTIFALYFGLFASRTGRYTPCLVLGLMRDFFSIGLLGSYGVLYSLLHKAAEKAGGKIDPERPLGLLFLAAVGTFLVNFGYHGMLVISGDGIGWSRALERCACAAAATAPVAVLVYPLFTFVLQRLGIQRASGYWNF